MAMYLQKLYEEHHSQGGRQGFSIHERERGEYFSKIIGTGKKVLDLGCRDGTLTKHYVNGNQVTGVDIDKKLLAKANKLGIKTQHLDLYDNWKLRQKFDVVVAGEVLEHLYHPKKIIAKVAQVLKSDGTFIVSVPNAYIISARIRFALGLEIHAHYDPTHINLFSQNKLQQQLDEYFYQVKVTGFAPPAYRWCHSLSNSLFADDLVAVASRPK